MPAAAEPDLGALFDPASLAASLVDRSAGTADLGVPFTPLIRLAVPSYSPDALPPELAAIPAIKPGSRAA
jgi:orotate phosphoribosyltransferase